jgi:serine/threonine-protein kinase
VRLLDVLGRGSSAVVYRALLESGSRVRRLVAIKLFGTAASDDVDHVLDAAARTARRGACVRHPNVVEIYDVGLVQNQPFFVLELVEGASLQTLLDRYGATSRRLPLDVALFIGCEMAEALSGARTARDHEGFQLGMVHLGLGPRKVLLSWRGEVKVGDFETSMTLGASSSVRSLRSVTHRTSTMAPEVAQGAPGDARSDVFSLGLVLRELFVGQRFPKNVTNAEAVRLAREGFVQPISFQPHLPEALVQIMQRALQCDPAERYPNASALAFDLRRVALALGVGDGRLFLKRALEREWGNDAEVTHELPHAFTPAPAAPIQPDDLHDLEGLPTIAERDVLLGGGGADNDDIVDADLIDAY